MGANGRYWRTMMRSPSEITECRWPAPTNNNQQQPAISINVQQHPLSYTNIHQYTFQRGAYNSGFTGRGGIQTPLERELFFFYFLLPSSPPLIVFCDFKKRE